MITRRTLTGLLVFAPAIVHANSLMPVRSYKQLYTLSYSFKLSGKPWERRSLVIMADSEADAFMQVNQHFVYTPLPRSESPLIYGPALEAYNAWYGYKGKNARKEPIW